MVKKGEGDNRFGFTSGILGIVSIVIGLYDSFGGIVLGILAIIFASIQMRKMKTTWSKVGLILGILGVILGIVSIIIIFNNPQLYSNQINAP